MRYPGLHCAATSGKCLIPRRDFLAIRQAEATPTAPVAARWLRVVRLSRRDGGSLPLTPGSNSRFSWQGSRLCLVADSRLATIDLRADDLVNEALTGVDIFSGGQNFCVQTLKFIRRESMSEFFNRRTSAARRDLQ